MERQNDTADLIELGHASDETKGVEGAFEDLGQNLIPQGGMTDD